MISAHASSVQPYSSNVMTQRMAAVMANIKANATANSFLLAGCSIYSEQHIFGLFRDRLKDVIASKTK